MKILKLSLSLLLACSFGPAFAQTNGDYLAVEASEVFVPNGFDDNDEVVVVVDGWLPDGCYRLVRPETYVDHEARTISITPMARWWDIPCIEMLVPYNFEVRLGVLPYGDYKVVVNKAQNVSEMMEINEATSAGPDEYLYAPVDNAAVTTDADSGLKQGVIKGRFTDSCMEFEEIKVSDDGKTVVVQPIVRHAPELGGCQAGVFPFVQKFALPAELKNGRHLMHVRSMNGFDLNVMFDIYRRQ